MSIKVFKVDETDWVAAETQEQAIECYEEMIGGKLLDLSHVHELTEKEMNELRHYGNDGASEKSYSFREKLDMDIEEDIDFPCHFASTEY